MTYEFLLRKIDEIIESSAILPDNEGRKDTAKDTKTVINKKNFTWVSKVVQSNTRQINAKIYV